jgi:uncharacterized protein (TIGR02246 family)
MDKELRALVAHLEKSWNSYDSQSFASVFAEDADFIHILGAHYIGRENVDKGHRAIFDTIYKGSHNQLEVQKIRPLGDDIAIVFTQSTLDFFQGEKKVRAQSRPTLVAQKKNGRWEIVTFQNTLQKDAVSDEVMERLVKAHPFQGKPRS